LKSGKGSINFAQVDDFELLGATVQVLVGARLSRFTIQSGTFLGASSASMTNVTASYVLITGDQPKTLQDVLVTAGSLDFACAAPSCQLFSTRAKIHVRGVNLPDDKALIGKVY